MTSKQVFEYALVELNKKEAPSLLLEDYNYFINKAINQYINKMYNAYDINQQKTDDLRVLKASAILTPAVNDDYGSSTLFNKVYEVDLPDDYLHILNCVVEYDILKNYKCYNSGAKWQQGASRLTADMFSQIINNYYLKPTYKSPYYYINNVNVESTYPTSDTQTDVQDNKYIVTVDYGNITAGDIITIIKNDLTSNIVTYVASGASTNEFSNNTELAATLTTDVGITASVSGNSVVVDDADISEISADTYDVSFGRTPSPERYTEVRYGNKSKVRMEIRYGKDNSIFALSSVYIDYVKAPQFIRLTQDQVDEVEDSSQLLEFPDYVCQEIINELVKILMENASDPRLQTHIPVSQSIAVPGQQPQR